MLVVQEYHGSVIPSAHITNIQLIMPKIVLVYFLPKIKKVLTKFEIGG